MIYLIKYYSYFGEYPSISNDILISNQVTTKFDYSLSNSTIMKY